MILALSVPICRYKQWVVACTLLEEGRPAAEGPHNTFLNKNDKFCDLHFEETQFMGKHRRDKLV